MTVTDDDLRGSRFPMLEVSATDLLTADTCTTCQRFEASGLTNCYGYCTFWQRSGGSAPMVGANFGCRAHLRRVVVHVVADPTGEGGPECGRCGVEQITHVADDGRGLCDTCAHLIGMPQPDDTPEAFPHDGICPHDDAPLRLAEGGYVRMWTLTRVSDSGPWIADDACSVDAYSDDGDGDYWVECTSCLRKFAIPDEWDWS